MYKKTTKNLKISALDSKKRSKGRSNYINHFIDMRPTVSESISCRKNMFLLENFNKNTFST